MSDRGTPDGSASEGPAPGYYPDPSIPGYIRYWDGRAWVPGSSRQAPQEGGVLSQPTPPAGPVWSLPLQGPFTSVERGERAAPVVRRFAARAVDALLKSVIVAGASAPLWLAALRHVRQRIDDAAAAGQSTTVWLIDGTTGALGAAVVAVALVTGFFYEALPTARWGRTTGKWLFALAVVDVEAMTPPGPRRATRRYLTRFLLNVLIIGFLTSSLWPVADYPRRQGWHDKAARTWVVRRSAPPLDWKPLRTRLRRLIGPVRRWYESWARRPERTRTTEAAAKAEKPQGSKTRLDLVGLSDRPETAAAVGSIEAVLERVFRTLGPPPEGLSHDKEPVVHGGGGNAQ
ncbi:RDD family protein [Streptomyces melanogenes]|uniref:RDD family protein n=1 Tax=Streptomyces melanogenes TaxID=67326 RepID=UPI00167E62E3|nr:RDD family protein [Streptomyces melanogenes]GGP86896.1 hypothetical protein GCM10010278_76910 [Streptomyces melanogenes]